MPLFEYQCGQCGHAFETLVRSSASDNAPACPACGAVDTRRLFSAFSSNVRRGSFSSCTSDNCSSCGSKSRFT